MPIATIGMVVIFLMAFCIVTWQADRVRNAEDKAEFFKDLYDKTIQAQTEIATKAADLVSNQLLKNREAFVINTDLNESADAYAKRLGLKRYGCANHE